MTDPPIRLVGIFTTGHAYRRRDPSDGVVEALDVIGVDTEGRLWGLVVRSARGAPIGEPQGGLQRVSLSVAFGYDRWIPVSPDIDFPEDDRESDCIDINGQWSEPRRPG